MKFILEENHRNIPSDALLEDLKRVSLLLETDTLTQAHYKKYGKYGLNTFRKRFGGWNQALEKIGLQASIYQIAASQAKHPHQSVSREEIIADIRRVAALNHTSSISKSEYDSQGKYSITSCYRNFPTWNDALIAANLQPVIRVSGKKIDNSNLLKEIERIWISLGRQPTTKDVNNGISKYSLNTYTRHFGSWRKALEAFIAYVNDPSEDLQFEDVSKKDLELVEPEISYIEPSNPGVKNTSRNINQRLRFLVLSRDNFCCCACGASPAKDGGITVLHVDHITPWSKGGETTIDNLQTLCSKCNLGKSDLEL